MEQEGVYRGIEGDVQGLEGLLQVRETGDCGVFTRGGIPSIVNHQR